MQSEETAVTGSQIGLPGLSAAVRRDRVRAGARGRAMFDTAVQVARVEAATVDAGPGTVGGGYGFDRDFCIAWMFEAESRHARESNVVV